jgi:hypothetical protein
MSRRPRSGPARWAAAAAAALTLTCLGLVASTGPAYAEPFPFTDSFEGNPTDRWVADTVPGQTSVRLGNDARARTPTKLASLNAAPWFPSTARIYRTVTPDITQLPLSCVMTVSMRRVPNVPGPDPQSVETQVKLRSGGPDGQITSSIARSIYFTDRWETWTVGTFRYPSGTFTIDITAYHGRALVDDVTFSCIGLP